MDIFSALLGIVFGATISWIIRLIRIGRFHQQALLIVSQAEQTAQHVKKTAEHERQQLVQKQELLYQKELLAITQRQQELSNQKERLNLEKEGVKKELSNLRARQVALQKKEEEISALHHTALTSLERTGNLSLHDAKKELQQRAEYELQHWIQHRKSALLSLAEKEVQENAKELLLSAVERLSQTFTKDHWISQVNLQDRSIISKIIGKGGRNIETFESLLNVNFIIEEEPPKLLISSYDPVQRLIAKATLQKVLEGKINPITIQEAYEHTTNSLGKEFQKQAKTALRECSLPDSFPGELLEALGTLSCKSSLGQNVLEHSIEVSKLISMLADNFGVSLHTAKLAGLFHDIGKGLPLSFGETHASAGASFLKKYGINDDIVHAIEFHHGENTHCSPLTHLLRICDRISAGLPGNRREQSSRHEEIARKCEHELSQLPDIDCVVAHHLEHHLELVIREKQDLDPNDVMKNVETILCKLNLATPIHISLPVSQRSMWHTSGNYKEISS
jgi:ribonuclease Y